MSTGSKGNWSVGRTLSSQGLSLGKERNGDAGADLRGPSSVQRPGKQMLAFHPFSRTHGYR